MNCFRKKNAYTLVEMLISITIFMIFIGIVAGSYVTLVGANKNANEMQKLYHAARFIFDTFARELRSGAIDYNCIRVNPQAPDPECNQNLSGQVSVLAFLHAENSGRTLMRFRNDKIEISRQKRGAVLGAAWINETGWEPLNPAGFSIDSAKFELFPLKDPYARGNAVFDDVQYQPALGLELVIKGRTFRTTFSSRSYGSKNLYGI